MVTSFGIYILQASICSLVFYAFYYFFLRNENYFQLNRIYLIATILFSLSIPQLQISIYNAPDMVVETVVNIETQISESLPVATTETNSEVIEETTPIPYIWVIYMAGLLFFSIKLLINIIKVLRLKSKSKISKTGKYTLIETESNYPVFSFFHFVFWSTHLAYSEEEKQQILLHEQIHIDQHHTIDLLVFELIQIFMWFNPIIYCYKKSLKDTHEFIADQYVFDKYNYQLRYVDLLMKEAKIQKNNTLPVVHTFFNNQLKKRLIMIRNSNTKSNKLRLLGCLPIMAALIFVFGINTDAAAQTDIKAKKGSAYYVYIEGDDDYSITPEGERRTDDMIKDYVLEQVARSGSPKNLKKEEIFLIKKETRADEKVNPNDIERPPSIDYPEFEKEYRIVLTKNGKLGVVAKGNADALKVISFDATIRKPFKSESGAVETVSTIIEGNALNPFLMKRISSIDPSDLDKSSIEVRNIVVALDDKKYVISDSTKLGLNF